MDVKSERKANGGCIRSIFKKVSIVFLMLLMVFANGFEVEADGGGTVTVRVEVVNVDELDSGEVKIKVEKVDEDVVIYEKTVSATWKGEQYIALFEGVPIGGSCTITGEPVPGYRVPEPVEKTLTSFRGNFTKTVELEYTKENIPVTGIELDKTEMTLLKGQTGKVTATVIPENASNQELTWSSGNVDVAVVDGDGNIVAVSVGEATITATTVERAFYEECVVTVKEIVGINDIEMNAVTGEIVVLPDTVTAVLNDGTMELLVDWSGDPAVGIVDGEQVVEFYEAGIYVYTGAVEGTTPTEALDPVTLTVNVQGDSLAKVTSVTFDKESFTMYLDETETISIVKVEPEGADISTLIWESSDDSVVKITDVTEGTATIQGVSTGTAEVYVKNAGSTDPLDWAVVNVTIDPTITDPAYIAATTADSPEPVDQFESKQDVHIRCYNLPAGEYYVKVEEQGSQVPLGETNETDENENNDRIIVDAGETEVIFNLYEATGFKDGTKNSKSYFVSMSKEPEYPSGDDADGIPYTFMDNFKITSPVPTGGIDVNVVEVPNESSDDQEPLSAEMVGKDVILGREIKDKTALDTQYQDYLNPAYETDPTLPKYTDEAKLIGHLNPDGTVTWDEPKEVLKIGGYILLIELPDNYMSNLDGGNPDSEDGELLKEVHITRNKTVERTIKVWEINE